MADILQMIAPYPTVVLAAGDFPSREEPLQTFSTAKRIICCDSAAEGLVNYGLQPTYIVGDIDSLSPNMRSRYHNRIIHIAEQESNDLSKALRFCSRNAWNEVILIGLTGKREDHTLANLSILFAHSAELSLQAVTDYGVFTPIRQTTTFASRAGQQVSIFSAVHDSRFTYHGLRYPLDGKTLNEHWQGALNEALGDKFTIEVSEGGALIFMGYEAKNV